MPVRKSIVPAGRVSPRQTDELSPSKLKPKHSKTALQLAKSSRAAVRVTLSESQWAAPGPADCSYYPSHATRTTSPPPQFIGCSYVAAKTNDNDCHDNSPCDDEGMVEMWILPQRLTAILAGLDSASGRRLGFGSQHRPPSHGVACKLVERWLFFLDD